MYKKVYMLVLALEVLFINFVSICFVLGMWRRNNTEDCHSHSTSGKDNPDCHLAE